MTAKADWLVVTGFFFAVMGVFLRIFIMMRSSDSAAVNATPAAARHLLRNYSNAFPRSGLPLAMRIALGLGSALLIAGLLLEFR